MCLCCRSVLLLSTIFLVINYKLRKSNDIRISNMSLDFDIS